MLPDAGRLGKNLACGNGSGGVPKEDRVDCSRVFERRFGEYRRTGPVQRDCRSGSNGGTGRYFRALPSAAIHMVQGKADVGDGAAGEGCEVLDGIYPGIRLLDFPERSFLDDKAELQQLHVHGVPEWCLPKESLIIPQDKEANTAPISRTSDEDVGGQDLC